MPVQTQFEKSVDSFGCRDLLFEEPFTIIRSFGLPCRKERD